MNINFHSLFIFINIVLTTQYLCPDPKYACDNNKKCCPSGYPWTLYECCPWDMECCGRTCCNKTSICCGSVTKAGSVCCDPNKTMCCGENQKCYDKFDNQCCSTGQICPKDKTCCNKVLTNINRDLDYIKTQICCPKYTKCCELILFDYCCPKFDPLFYIPIIIASISLAIIIFNYLKSPCEIDNDELVEPLMNNTIITPYGTQTFSTSYSIRNDDFFSPKLGKYQTYQQFRRAVIGIANTYFRTSSTIYLFFSLLSFTFCIVCRGTILIFSFFLLLVLIKFFHFIICWLGLGFIRSTYLHWLSLLFILPLIGISFYLLVDNANTNVRPGFLTIFFPLLSFIILISFFCSVGYCPIINLNRNGNILTIQIGNSIAGSSNYGSASSSQMMTIELPISQYIK